MGSPINLAQLPAPAVVEALDYETILSQQLADLRRRAPEYDALVESDPAYKILEVSAYRELLVRQRINDTARSILLAYAAGSDLEHLAALFGVTRQVVDPGDPDATPSVEPTYESDDRLRVRILLSVQGYSSAGPVEAYRFHAFAASPQVKDAGVVSPNPGDVTVSVLSTEGNGTADTDLIGAVKAALNREEVRPLTDTVTVQSAAILEYQIEATLTLEIGPDAALVRAQALERVRAYCRSRHGLGLEVALSGIIAALQVAGVRKVVLTEPAADLAPTVSQAAYCTDYTLN